MLFQIEEPDGRPNEQDGRGLALAIDLGGPVAAIAVSVGGNAEMLRPQQGLDLPPTRPPAGATGGQGQAWLDGLLLEARRVAERSLSRPVTHAVIIVPRAEATPEEAYRRAAGAAGLRLTRVIAFDGSGAAPADSLLKAALLAEDEAVADRP